MELPLIQTKIYRLRDQLVMLDADLAALYAVPTKRLKEAVRRNRERFPPDFMFELSRAEFDNLRSQMATSSWGGARHLPFAFTEHGVAMLSGILHRPRAIETNIQIIRAFIALRHYACSFEELATKLLHHDRELADIQEVLRWLGDEKPGPARGDQSPATRRNSARRLAKPSPERLSKMSFNRPVF